MLRKIISVVFGFLFCTSVFFAKTYEELVKEFDEIIANSSSIQKKQLQTAKDNIMALPDKNLRKTILEATLQSMPKPAKTSQSQSKTESKTQTTVSTKNSSTRIANLKNPKTYESEIQDIIRNYVFEGAGTPDDPVLISKVWELFAISECFSSGDDRFDSIRLSKNTKQMPQNLSYRLEADLDFSGLVWETPIGILIPKNGSGEFSTVFDGNGHSLMNFNGTAPLFATIGTNGVVKNLKIKNSTLNFNKKFFIHSSAFCENLEGVLLNCSFEGKMSSSKEIYEIGFSKSGSGVAVGCVSKNSGSSRGDGKNIVMYGCTSQKSKSSSVLNDAISNWNALYYDNEKYFANYHFDSSNELVKGSPALKKLSKDSLPRTAIFSNAYNFTFSKNNSYVCLLEPIFPKDTTVEFWGSNSKVEFIPNGKTVSIRNSKLPAYSLAIYVQQFNGSYKKIVLDTERAYVKEAFDNGKEKGLCIAYSRGSNPMVLLTKEAKNSIKKFDFDKNGYVSYGLKLPYSSWIEYPSSQKINSIIQNGNW